MEQEEGDNLHLSIIIIIKKKINLKLLKIIS